MKTISFPKDGVTGCAQRCQGTAFRSNADAFGFVFTDETTENFEMLSPIEPRIIIGIGIVVTR